MSRHGSRRISVAASIVLALAVSGVGSSVAWADEVQPGNVAPTISSVTPTGSVTPTAGGSTPISVAVALGDANSLDDLKTVVVVLYNSAAGDSTGVATDARNTVKMTYTVDGNVGTAPGFSIVPSAATTWALGTGGDLSTGLSDGTATSGTVTFRFKVGEVAKQGAWSVRTIVTDMSDAVDSDTAADAMTVGWYGEFTSAGSKDFGTVAMDGSASVTSAHTVQTNGAAKLLYSTSATWSNGAQTIGLVNTVPGAREFSYLVNAGTTVGTTPGTDTTYLTTSPASPFGLSSIASGGSVEGGASVDDVASITIGSAIPAGSAFSGTVTISIAAA